MKAILVIEMPNDLDISKVRIGGDGNIYFMRDGEKASIVGNIRNIKPMPQKSGLVHQDVDGWCKLSEYSRGWNDCIDEILGEQNGNI